MANWVEWFGLILNDFWKKEKWIVNPVIVKNVEMHRNDK